MISAQKFNNPENSAFRPYSKSLCLLPAPVPAPISVPLPIRADIKQIEHTASSSPEGSLTDGVCSVPQEAPAKVVKPRKKRCDKKVAVFSSDLRGIPSQTHLILRKVLEGKTDDLEGCPMPDQKATARLRKIIVEQYQYKRPTESVKAVCQDIELAEYMRELYKYVMKRILDHKMFHIRMETEDKYVSGYKQEIEKLDKAIAEFRKKICPPQSQGVAKSEASIKVEAANK